jgi:hypothetical protein
LTALVPLEREDVKKLPMGAKGKVFLFTHLREKVPVLIAIATDVMYKLNVTCIVI